METRGSCEEHDRDKIERFLSSAFEGGLAADGVMMCAALVRGNKITPDEYYVWIPTWLFVFVAMLQEIPVAKLTLITRPIRIFRYKRDHFDEDVATFGKSETLRMFVKFVLSGLTSVFVLTTRFILFGSFTHLFFDSVDYNETERRFVYVCVAIIVGGALGSFMGSMAALTDNGILNCGGCRPFIGNLDPDGERILKLNPEGAWYIGHTDDNAQKCEIDLLRNEIEKQCKLIAEDFILNC